MTQAQKTSKELRAERQRARLAEQLRSNLKKRKNQARGRTAAEGTAREAQGREAERSGS